MPTARTPKRKCHGENAKGEPCGANPLKPGTVIEDVEVSGDFCRQHDQDLPDTARIGGAQPGAGRPKNPRIVDTLRELAESRASEVLNTYMDALSATRSIVVGSGDNAFVDEVPDWPTRLRAAEAINDRSYGRPRQEITGADGAPVQLEVTGALIVGDREARKHAGQLRRRIASSRKVESGRARARG